MNHEIELRVAELKKLVVADGNTDILIIVHDDKDSMIQGYGCPVCLIAKLIIWAREKNLRHNSEEEMITH